MLVLDSFWIAYNIFPNLAPVESSCNSGTRLWLHKAAEGDLPTPKPQVLKTWRGSCLILSWVKCLVKQKFEGRTDDDCRPVQTTLMQTLSYSQGRFTMLLLLHWMHFFLRQRSMSKRLQGNGISENCAMSHPVHNQVSVIILPWTKFSGFVIWRTCPQLHVN